MHSGKLINKMMKDKDIIAVFIPNEEARRFLLFKQHFDVFNILLDNSVFDIRNGSVALHFDSLGTLQTIQRADILYSRKFEKRTYPQADVDKELVGDIIKP